MDICIGIAFFVITSIFLIAGLIGSVFQLCIKHKPQEPGQGPTEKATSKSNPIAGACPKSQVEALPEDLRHTPAQTQETLPLVEKIELSQNALPSLPASGPLTQGTLNPLIINHVTISDTEVDADSTYEASLAEKTEVDHPESTTDNVNAEIEEHRDYADHNITLSGQASWITVDNDELDKEYSEIARAIFRNGYQTLILQFRNYPTHNWPKEFKLQRETSNSFAGHSDGDSVSVYCSIQLSNATGNELSFKGKWYLYPSERDTYLPFEISGTLQHWQGQMLPELPQHILGIPPLHVAAAPEPVDRQADLQRPPPSISIPSRRFSIGFGNFRGNPFIEILENQKSWGETHPMAGKHFCFGKRKALMVLSCRQTIARFVAAPLTRPSALNQDLPSNPKLGGNITIIGQDYFRIGQREIRRPYLQLIHKEESFAFGLAKADALVTLMNDIESWATSL